MNGDRCESLFFTSLPDLRRLCAINVILNPTIKKSDLRDAQIKLCRYLLFQYQDIVASPLPDELSQILLITAISFYKTCKLQAAVEKHGAKMEPPVRAIPAFLQTCLSYTLTARLTPRWNKAGHLLIQGEDFLSQMGRQNAIVMDIYVSETQLCISLKVYTVRLPPPELGEFDISASAIQKFYSSKDSELPSEAILSNWCYVLPSMKMGKIISVHHTIPPGVPFQSYSDMQVHWNNLYGYSLPAEEENSVYCSVYFKLIGQRLFTYPFICLRSQPVQFFPRADFDGTLNTFISELKSILPHLCGFPVRMTSKPCYTTTELSNPNIQEVQCKPVNLSGKSNIKPSMTRAPAAKLVSSQPPTAKSRGQGDKPVLFSSQASSYIFPNVGPLSESSPLSLKNTHPSTPSSLVLHQPLRGSQSSSQNNETARIIPIFKSQLMKLSQANMKTPDRKKRQSSIQKTSVSKKENTAPSATVVKAGISATNTSDLTASTKGKQHGNNVFTAKPSVAAATSSFSLKMESYTLEGVPSCTKRVSSMKNTREPINKKMKPFLSASSKQAMQTPTPNKVVLKEAKYKLNPKEKCIISNLENTCFVEMNHIVQSLGHSPQSDLATQLASPCVSQHTEAQTKGAALDMNFNIVLPAGEGPAEKTHAGVQKRQDLKLRKEFSAMVPNKSFLFNPCNEQEEMFEVKHSKSKTKPSVLNVDVEEHAKNNQLSKLNSATLHSWLKHRGVSVRTRDKKEVLVSKIMQFINET